MLPKGTLNFGWIYCRAVFRLTRHPIRNGWKNLLARRCNLCGGWIEDSSFKSSPLSRLRSPDGLAVFFLRPISEVLIAEKKKQTSLSFEKVRSHSSLFSQIQFQARSISLFSTLQMHLKETTEHFFSTAAIIWHSALSRITLLLS